MGLRTGRANGKPDLERLDFTKPIRHSNFCGKYWRKATRAAGVSDSVVFYDLQHAGISDAVANMDKPGTESIAEISARAGHASKVMTLDRYTHAPDRHTERERAARDARFTPPSAASNVTPLRGRPKVAG